MNYHPISFQYNSINFETILVMRYFGSDPELRKKLMIVHLGTDLKYIENTQQFIDSFVFDTQYNYYAQMQWLDTINKRDTLILVSQPKKPGYTFIKYDVKNKIIKPMDGIDLQRPYYLQKIKEDEDHTSIWFITNYVGTSDSIIATNQDFSKYFEFKNVGGSQVGDSNTSLFQIVKNRLYMRAGQNDKSSELGNIYEFNQNYTESILTEL